MVLYNIQSLEQNYSSTLNSEYVDKVFKKNEVMTIDIISDEDNWSEMIKNASAEEYIPADIVINGEKVSTVGIRPKGNSSLNMVASDETTDRYSFKIDFAEYVDGQSFYGLKKLALNNMIGDASYMKEYLSYDLMAELNISTPAYAYANITLNGEPWGLYLAVEVLEESFLDRYYGSDYGNLYKPETAMGAGAKPPEGQAPPNGQAPPADQTPPDANSAATENSPPAANTSSKNSNGINLVYTGDELESYSGIFDNVVTKATTKNDYKTVIEMIKALDEGSNLEEHFNIDEILRYFAANTFLVNLDSYAGSMKHNYYLYEKNGIFEILPWDFNLSFGAFQHGSASEIINFPIDTPFTDSAENTPLISNLLEIDEYKQIYHEYLSDIVENYIESGKFESSINRLDKLISKYVINDKTAFFSYSEYTSAVKNLKIYGTDRGKSITLQLNGSQPSDNYGNVETTMNASAMGSFGGPKNENDRMKAKGTPPNMQPPNSQSQNVISSQDLIKLGVSILSLLLITLFTYKFKRKKFHSK